VTFSVEYNPDSETLEQIEVIRTQLLREAMRHDAVVNCDLEPATPGFVAETHGAVDQKELDRITSIFATIPDYVLWDFCTILGFQAINECFSN
jgi:hypothetical protein